MNAGGKNNGWESSPSGWSLEMGDKYIIILCLRLAVTIRNRSLQYVKSINKLRG